jgi:TetR/AcrR family tetracycline transcriptional repressor
VATERLDRDRVVKAAIDLLDEVGLDGLTLRRLAAELGVQAPALYWHFKNKQALLDQMAETISTNEAPVVPPAPGETWDVWLANRARTMRRALNSHRDGAMLAASTHPQPGQWKDIEMQMGVLVGAGLTPAEALRTMMAVGNYVSGFMLEEQADRMRGDASESDPEQWERFRAEVADYPLMSQAVDAIGDPQDDASFEAGIALIIDGIRWRITPTR